MSNQETFEDIDEKLFFFGKNLSLTLSFEDLIASGIPEELVFTTYDQCEIWDNLVSLWEYYGWLETN